MHNITFNNIQVYIYIYDSAFHYPPPARRPPDRHWRGNTALPSGGRYKHCVTKTPKPPTTHWMPLNWANMATDTCIDTSAWRLNYVCIYRHTYIHYYINTYIHNIHTHAYMWLYMHLYAYTPKHIYTSTYRFIHMYIYIHRPVNV